MSFGRGVGRRAGTFRPRDRRGEEVTSMLNLGKLSVWLLYETVQDLSCKYSLCHPETPTTPPQTKGRGDGI